MPPEAAGGYAAPVLACDLDGTLASVNTFPLFVRFALRRLWRHDPLAWARLAAALVRRKALGGAHLALKAAAHEAGARLPAAELHGWAAEVLARTGNDEVAALVRGWEGTTVLVTAAPQVYAEVIGALAGFDAVEGSDREGGAYRENVHAAKAERLRRGLTGPLECAVSDDAAVDGPLLAMAARPLLVGADGRVAGLRAS